VYFGCFGKRLNLLLRGFHVYAHVLAEFLQHLKDCTDDDGKEKAASERFKLPPDIANGMTLTLLKNIRPNVTQTTVSMVAATPKPRLVKLLISPEGEDSFSVGGSSHKATRYVIKVEIVGIAGLAAPLVGKQPQDTHVWILGGDAPVFVKLEGPLYQGGPHGGSS
jgi:hypothetical protein